MVTATGPRPGGRRVGGLREGRLRVGPSHHPAEVAADDLARQVLGAPGPRLATPGGPGGAEIRRSGGADHGASAPPEVERGIAAARGGGRPLPAELRRRAEQVLATDLSPVRLHDGAPSAAMNARLGSAAFAIGTDVHLGGRLPAAAQQQVLAHELAHVAQCDDGTVRRWFLGQATRTKDAAALVGQDRQADNSFRQQAGPGMHDAIETSTLDPTAVPLRISEDLKIAIEDTGADRQAKVFFASGSVVKSANDALAKRGSKYLLHVAAGRTIEVQDPQTAKKKKLDTIEPLENPHYAYGKKRGKKKNEWQSKTMGQLKKQLKAADRGAAVTVDATCVAVAEKVMGGTYGGTGTYKGPEDLFAPLGLVSPLDQGNWMFALADALGNDGVRTPGAINEGAVARAYGVFANKHPKRARRIAERLGVNEHAEPEVGQAFVSESIGAVNPGAATTNWMADRTGGTAVSPLTPDATVRGGAKRTGWGNHVGAVVAASAGNSITFENYARSGEDPALVANDKIWYFAMYGPPSKRKQTWHHVWTKGAAPVINGVTGVIG